MRILTWYVLRQHVAPFAFAAVALTFLMLLDQVADQLGKLVGKGLGLAVVGEVFLYSIPFILAVILPMAVLVAVLYAFNRLAADNEIAAMKASGISLVRIVFPLVVVSTFLAGGMVWFNDAVLPESNHRLAQLLASIARKKPTFVLEHEQTINEILPGQLYLQAARIDRRDNELRDVTIYDQRQPTRSRTFYADSAEMAFNENQTVLYLTLYDGVMHETDEENPESHQRVYFDRQVMRVPEVSNTLDRERGDYRGDRELPIAAMRAEADTALQLAHRASEQTAAFATALTRKLLGLPLPTPGQDDPEAAGAAGPGGTQKARGSPPPRPTARSRSGKPPVPRSNVKVSFRAGEMFGLRDGTVRGRARRARRNERQEASRAQESSSTVDSTGRALRAAHESILAREALAARESAAAEAARDSAAAEAARDSAAAEAARDSAQAAEIELLREARVEARAVRDARGAASAFERHRTDWTLGLQRAARYQVEIQKKFSIPAACIVFVLIGAPIAVRFRRGGVGLVVAVSLGVFCLYYVALIGGEHLADKNVLSPFWAMWSINVLFGAIGLVLLWRARQVESS